MKQKIRSLFITLLAMLVAVGTTLLYIAITPFALVVVFIVEGRIVGKAMWADLKEVINKD